MLFRIFTLTGLLPVLLLLSGCEAGTGGTSNGCQDTIMEEKIDEIEGIKDTENAKDEVVNLGDTVQLLNRRGRDGRGLKCVTDPASWVSGQNSDCANDIFVTLRHKSLECRNHGNWVDLVRPARPAALPKENIIVRIERKNGRWNGPSRIAQREGNTSVARIALHQIVVTENEDGKMEERCEPADAHIEIRGDYVFEKVVEFVAKTLEIIHPSFQQCIAGIRLSSDPPISQCGFRGDWDSSQPQNWFHIEEISQPQAPFQFSATVRFDGPSWESSPDDLMTSAGFSEGPGYGAWHTIMEFGEDSAYFGVYRSGHLTLYQTITSNIPLQLGTTYYVSYTWDGQQSTLVIKEPNEEGKELDKVINSVIPPRLDGVGFGVGYFYGDTPWQGTIKNACVSIPSACLEPTDAINDLSRTPAEWTELCTVTQSFLPFHKFRLPLHPRLLCRPTKNGMELLQSTAAPVCRDDTLILTMKLLPGRVEDVRYAREEDMIVSRFSLSKISSVIGWISLFLPNIPLGNSPCVPLDFHFEMRGHALFEPVIRFVSERMEATYGPCAF